MKDEVVTLMMVTYNRIDLTKQTLKALFENTKTNFNLVIIDNASSDGTIDYLKDLEENLDESCLDKLVVVYNDENKGIAVGRNQALVEADKLETTWYSTIDNDVILPVEWLGKCIATLRDNKALGMVGVNFEKEEFPVVDASGHLIQLKPRGNLGTACTVFNKKLHQALGFFSTEYGLYGEEDADMGMRARVMGFKLAYLAENGIHLGEGENDQGEYREFKTACHKNNLKKFNNNVAKYHNNMKPLYIPFKGEK